MITFPLPHEDEPDFAERIRERDSRVAVTVADLKAITADPTVDVEDRFAALYWALHRLQREYKYVEFRALCDEYEREFGQRAYFDTFRVIALRAAGGDSAKLKNARRWADRARVRLPDRPGVLHQYAMIIADLGDLGVALPRGDYVSALESVERAIATTPRINANFLATRSRLLRLTEEFEEALREINTALSIESAEGPDAARRISRLESVRTQIILDRRQKQVEQMLDQTEASMSALRSEQLQQLGILAAVIALITAGVSVASRSDVGSAIRLMLATAGAVSVAFTMIIGMLSGAKWWRVLVSLTAGVALILAGLWVKP